MTALDEALELVRSQSNLTDGEYKDLCQMVTNRLDGGATPTVCGAPEQSWEVPKLSAWVTTAELARVLGISLDLCAKWGRRSKLPTPDERVNGRACWSRKTVRQFCEGLQLLNGAGS